MPIKCNPSRSRKVNAVEKHYIRPTCNGAVYLGAILQLNCDCFMAQFHQKPADAYDEFQFNFGNLVN